MILSEITSLLERLVATPSLSRQEDKTAQIIVDFFVKKGIKNVQRSQNNAWVFHPDFSPQKPTILLNSHHDTVKAGHGWESDPFIPTWSGDRLTGLGSNDAGGPLVCLMGTFLHFYPQKNLPFNLVLAATAEEEISGKNGIASILPDLGKIDLAIVGEPTMMDMAIAEKGLMVLDCSAKGRTGHAARGEGLNAIYESLADIHWFQEYEFPEKTHLLGPVKMTVTQIEAGSQHNVVPDRCNFVVDVRTNECYSNEEVFEYIQGQVICEVKPRSFRLNSSRISMDHPIVKRGLSLGKKTYGSPTLSDQALMPFTTIKIGPGDSARSHTPNEHIFRQELKEGLEGYIALLDKLVL